jgi:hypothetical protein
MFKKLAFQRRQRIEREARYWEQWMCAGREPALSSMIDDPIVRLVMKRDGLTSADVWRIVERAQLRLGVVGGGSAAPSAGKAALPLPATRT